MKCICFVRIPWEPSKPLENLHLELSSADECCGDQIPGNIIKYVEAVEKEQFSVEALPLRRMASHDMVAQGNESALNLAGLYAYYVAPTSETNLELQPNVRATCLSMACGLYSQRFFGDVFVSRLGYFPDNQGAYRMSNWSLTALELRYACETPDLRVEIIQKLFQDEPIEEASLPLWLTEAAKENYEDAAAISLLSSAMLQGKNMKFRNSNYPESSIDESGYESDSSSVACESESKNILAGKDGEFCATSSKICFVTKVPLCLHCRCPSNNLCPFCHGAYFCPEPKNCSRAGWSHEAVCKTWALYTGHRNILASFPFHEWHVELLGRENQISDEPYRNFLSNTLGVIRENRRPNWWSTEVEGWSGGESESAKMIDLSCRVSYVDGFALEAELLPPEHPVTLDDILMAKLNHNPESNMVELNSWEDYYKLRRIPLTSPVSLLLTFPLTIYYALLKHGSVPITVANMLRRQLRIHLVGIEKELNFIDIFKELAYILPQDLHVELVFIVRHDMLPSAYKSESDGKTHRMKIKMGLNLTIIIESGIYNESLDPNFDCGTGPPDMVIGLNAGLYAYKSWRSVIDYLNCYKGVIGVFTDYNEYSGVNCASLGGTKARETLVINPFRQPHALPVYSMNLPQFSNGFMYAINAQELDA